MSKLTKLLSGAAICGLLGVSPALAQQQGQQFGQQGQQWSQQQQGQQQGQGGLGRNEVEQFLQQVENNLTQAVQQGNHQAILQWIQQHVGDEATFVGLVRAYGPRSNEPKGWAVMTGTKQDMLERRQAMFSAAPELLNSIQNYDLRIQVTGVHPISQNVSLVQTRIRESGSLGRGGMQQVGQQWGSGQQQYGQAQYGGQQQQQFGQTAGMGAGTGGQGQGQQFQGMQGQQGQSQDQLQFSSNANCEHVMYRGQQGDMIIGKSTCQGEVSHAF